MKSFDEFLETLAPADLETISNQAFSQLPDNGHTYSADELRLMTKVATVAAFSMREILRRYHEWMAKQID